MNGPIAHEALLSLALPSSSALRPSKSRRLTSLPSVAPRIRPRESTASTISGSGLFQVEFGCTPISAPWPTAAIGCVLVKISASGPIPTSRYCDHAPCSTRICLMRAASAEPGRTLAKSSPRMPCRPGAYRFGAARVTARLLFDHALQRARDKSHAGRLDRLQVAGGEQPRRTGVEIAATVGEKRIDPADEGPCAARIAGARSSRSSHALAVGASADRSTTAPSGRTVIGAGPPGLPGSQARPSNVDVFQSEGRARSDEDGIAIERFEIIEASARRRTRPSGLTHSAACDNTRCRPITGGSQ